MKTVILGGGSYAESMIAYIQEHSTLEPVSVLDDDPGKLGSTIEDVEVRGPLSRLEDRHVHEAEAVLVCLGANRLRQTLVAKSEALGFVTPAFVHPRASVSKAVFIGPGVFVLDGAVVQPHSRLNSASVVSANATVSHHSVLGEATYLAAGVTIGAGVHLGARVLAGVASAVMTGVHQVGDDSVLGAGAVVIRDVPTGAVMVGVPARQLRHDG